ncbi:MAG: hypothetical protein OXN17_16855 [Candidatus Poribacteria bacterium]|nr:hypothetical protein [Candidatus Poribacteria bacterium]MDE0503204.1 hypothetical protein [Candidatus Poribacteria bacterium]
MNAYAEAFKNSDFKGMRLLETADLRKRWNPSDPSGFTLEAEVIRRESEFGTEVIENPVVVEEARLQLERLMFEPVIEMITQATIVDSGYFGNEFHFRLGMPAPEIPAPSKETVIETEIPPPPDTLVKMRKEDGQWRIYESHTLN